MTSRSACEPLPKPTLSPFALARPGTFLRVGFFTAAVWCVPALRVPLVHSLINHFRKKKHLVAPPSLRGRSLPRRPLSQSASFRGLRNPKARTTSRCPPPVRATHCLAAARLAEAIETHASAPCTAPRRLGFGDGW